VEQRSHPRIERGIGFIEGHDRDVDIGERAKLGPTEATGGDDRHVGESGKPVLHRPIHQTQGFVDDRSMACAPLESARLNPEFADKSQAALDQG